MTALPLTVVEFAPGTAVQDLVLTYWAAAAERDVAELAAAPTEHTIWPDGCLGITMALEQGGVASVQLTGPRRTPTTLPVRPGLEYWGVRFRPEMGASFLGRPAPGLRDQVGRAHHWLGSERLRLLEAALLPVRAEQQGSVADAGVQQALRLVLDRWLFDSADTTMPPEDCVRDAVRAIVATEGRQQIATIAQLADVSPRHLQRCFKDAVGLSPKEYALIRQARHAAAADPNSAPLVLDLNRYMLGAPDALRRRLAAAGFSLPVS